MRNQEGPRKHQFEHFKKQAMLVFTTAFRLPLMLMLGCGYVNIEGKKYEVHDYDGTNIVTISEFNLVPYNEAQHRKIENWLNVSQSVPGVPDVNGKKAVHVHTGNTGKKGPYRYKYV